MSVRISSIQVSFVSHLRRFRWLPIDDDVDQAVNTHALTR